MSKRLDLWGRSSRITTDARDNQTDSSPYFRPTFRKPTRQTSPDITEEEVKAEPSTEVNEPTTVPLDSKERVDAPIDPLEVDMRRKPYRRVAEHKARRRAMSISVSEEEERILRKHAASMDRSFSEWARSVLFRAVGRKIPSRGRNID
jgi:hypothetical protein